MDRDILVNGKTIRNTEKESINGRMAINMKVSINVEKDKALELWYMQMDKVTKEIGWMGLKKVKEFIKQARIL